MWQKGHSKAIYTCERADSGAEVDLGVTSDHCCSSCDYAGELSRKQNYWHIFLHLFFIARSCAKKQSQKKIWYFRFRHTFKIRNNCCHAGLLHYDWAVWNAWWCFVSYHVVKHLLFFLNPVRQPSYTYTFPEICSLFITIVHFVMNTQTYAAEEKKRKREMNVR